RTATPRPAAPSSTQAQSRSGRSPPACTHGCAGRWDRSARATSSAWETCTWPMTGSPPTSAGPRVRRTCATRCMPTPRPPSSTPEARPLPPPRFPGPERYVLRSPATRTLSSTAKSPTFPQDSAFGRGGAAQPSVRGFGGGGPGRASGVVLLTQPRHAAQPRPDARFPLVERPDPVHIGANVAGEPEGGAQPGGHSSAVHVGQGDRQVRSTGDAVEARAPVLDAPPGPLGGDHQVEPFAGLEPGKDLSDHPRGITTVDGNPAQCAHEPAEGPFEHLVLAEVAHPNARPPANSKNQHEVHVRDVRVADNDAGILGS